MTQNAENRIECALTTMINDADKIHLRKLQAEMHKCAAKCCENKECSIELVHACIEVCSQNLKRAQKVVQSEIIHFQKRLQECVFTCNNDVKKNIEKQPIDLQIKAYESGFDNCVEKCVDTNIALIPFKMKKMKEILAKKPQDLNENKN